ncbi:MAG: MBL fold metallo-hydrolase [Microbacterium sp.]|nr:MBL fold metallo-hydrolase [Microbacterium sp.]MBN9173046.1 MBL fold metallo-hydrolase [Microbacterium sp.]
MFNSTQSVQQGVTSLHQLPTGSYSTRAALAFRGGSLFETRQFSATPVLLRHPSGDVLLDAGFGRDFEQHLAMLPRFRRSPHELGVAAVDQLAAAGYDLDGLAGILLTHSHWDHVSGIADLDVPILITADELRYAADARDDRVFTAVSAGRTVRTYEFDGGPFEGFPFSHDLYGDGAIVIVPAPGHTTGSVIVFVTTVNAQRFAFIGDLAWQLEGVERNVDRPLLMRMLADSDRARVRTDLAAVGRLASRWKIVPAHDPRAFAGIPTLDPDQR